MSKSLKYLFPYDIYGKKYGGINEKSSLIWELRIIVL